MREIILIAGETSGDAHAAGVARELTKNSEVTLVGIGGDEMRRAGVELVAHIRSIAVMGFIDPISKLPQLRRLFRLLKERLASGNVGAIVLVDYPGFNLRVAAAATELGVPVLYYITPQVWAWHASRLTAMARTITKAAVILDFEEDLLRRHGIDATFVGHPLLDRAQCLPTRAEARRQLGLSDDAPVLALFPGSRRQEVTAHLESFVEAARRLQARIQGLQVIVSKAPDVAIDRGNCPFPTADGVSLSVFRAADVGMCKSGTTTLEAAVTGCPIVVGYRTNPISYFAARRLIRIPDISLVNVIAGRRVVPELLQHELEPGAMVRQLEPLFDSGSGARETMLAGLSEVRQRLGQPGAGARVAEMALRMAGVSGGVAVVDA